MNLDEYKLDLKDDHDWCLLNSLTKMLASTNVSMKQMLSETNKSGENQRISEQTQLEIAEIRAKLVETKEILKKSTGKI